MKRITSTRELRRLADKGQLQAVRKELWGKPFYGRDIRYPKFFSAGSKPVEFYIETVGARTSILTRKSKNFVFFTR